jgi:GABA permease
VRTYLVVANQTLPGAELREAIRTRLEAGPSSFHVLVPNTRPRDLGGDVGKGRIGPVGDPYGWVGPRGGVQDTPVGRRAHADQATAQAQYRLGQLLGDLRRMGVDADGELGDADPLKAVGEVLKHRQVDEIVLSTLPKPVSRWLAVDLPHRLQRRFGLPVTTVTTKR